jgi:hypothetical protein
LVAGEPFSAHRRPTSRSRGGFDDGQERGRIGRVVPSDIEHLPTEGGEPEIPALVGGLGLATEVEGSAVGLDPQPDRREREVEARDEATRRIPHGPLPFERRQRRRREASFDEVLEPRVPRSDGWIDRCQQIEEHSGPRLPRPMKANRRPS